MIKVTASTTPPLYWIQSGWNNLYQYVKMKVIIKLSPSFTQLNKMKKFLIAFLIIFIIASSVVFVWGKGKFYSPQKSQNYLTDTLLYRINGGKIKQVSLSDSDIASDIGNSMLELLRSADSTFRLMVTPDMLKQIRKKDHVEIIFKTEKDIDLSKIAKGHVAVKRILIGLEGKLSWTENGRCVIFYGDPEIRAYNFAVVTNPSISKAHFVKLIRNLQQE